MSSKKSAIRFTGYLYTLFSYLILSRFKGLNLKIPDGKKKGVIFSYDVETLVGKNGEVDEESANADDEYYRYIPELLNVFKDYSISTHFFVCGKVLENYSDIFKHMIKNGHGLGGHGYAHEKMYSLSYEQQMNIVKKVSDIINEKYNIKMNSWRCPGLAANHDTYRVLRKNCVSFSSNSPWGKPLLIEGVLELPLVRKMDDNIIRRSRDPSRWAEYMEKKFNNTSNGILIFGMHTWIQRKIDPKYEILTSFLDYIEPYMEDIWHGRMDDLSFNSYSNDNKYLI